MLPAANLKTREEIYKEVQHVENRWGKGKKSIRNQKMKKIREVEVGRSKMGKGKENLH